MSDSQKEWEEELAKPMLTIDQFERGQVSAIKSFKLRIDSLRKNPSARSFDDVTRWLTKWLASCNINNYRKTKNTK